MPVPDEEFVAAVRENEPAGTQEVADAVGLTRQGADYRLRQLKRDGEVCCKTIGGVSVWFLPDDGD